MIASCISRHTHIYQRKLFLAVPTKSILQRSRNSYLWLKERHLPLQDWRIQPKPGHTPSAAMTPTDHHHLPQNRRLQTEKPSPEDWRKDLMLNAPVERLTKHQNITYSSAHSTSKRGSRYGPLVCPLKPSSGGLQRICSWHPSMRYSLERGSNQINHHIECRRRIPDNMSWDQALSISKKEGCALNPLSHWRNITGCNCLSCAKWHHVWASLSQFLSQWTQWSWGNLYE